MTLGDLFTADLMLMRLASFLIASVMWAGHRGDSSLPLFYIAVALLLIDWDYWGALQVLVIFAFVLDALVRRREK